jgi:hypothetical protein
MQLMKLANPASLLMLFAVMLGPVCVVAQGPVDQATLTPPVTVSDVVQKLVQHNEERASRLRSYTSQRHYHLEYHGFPKSAEASMEVEAVYSAPSKTFHVLSESGSPKLINHVLKKLLKAEQDAAGEQRNNALTPANYDFSLLDITSENGRNLFVLQVDPKTSNKFLYRGRIWVDGEDYAVVRVEGEPSENPSFWIRNTEIRHFYSKMGNFWLPTQSRTVTKVRLGGTATLTIDFENYQLEGGQGQAAQVSAVARAN